MSEDCQKCGTAMDELTEQAEELGLYENIDLLTTCGTFDTKDCISVEQILKLLKDGETK